MRTRGRPKRTSMKAIKKDMIVLNLIEKITLNIAKWKERFM